MGNKNKRIENNGEVPQYYVEESHPPIIDKEMWEAVQLEMERRRAFAERYNISKLDYATVENSFAGRVICGHCGAELIETFDMDLFFRNIEKMTVFEGCKIIFTLLEGTEVQCVIE